MKRRTLNKINKTVEFCIRVAYNLSFLALGVAMGAKLMGWPQ